jgi:hypothetical protein
MAPKDMIRIGDQTRFEFAFLPLDLLERHNPCDIGAPLAVETFGDAALVRDYTDAECRRCSPGNSVSEYRESDDQTRALPMRRMA